MTDVVYSIKIEKDLRDEWQIKFAGCSGSEIEKLMRARLASKNITEAVLSIEDEKAERDNEDAFKALRDMGLEQYLEINQKAHKISASAYLDFYNRTGKISYIPPKEEKQ